MKKVSLFLLGMVMGLALLAQPVVDNAIIPVAVNLNSILRLNVTSGGNIEFTVSTIDQYNNGIATGPRYYTDFTVASSVDFDVIPVTLNTQGSFLIGDLNQDSVLDIIDVVSLVSIIMGNVDITSLDQLVGDLNGDTFLNVQDIILLVGIILSN